MMRHRFLLCLLLVASTWLLLVPGMAVASEEDVQALVQNVKVIQCEGRPGPVVPFGDSAFPVVVGDAGSAVQLPVVAAARFRYGRVVAFGDCGFLSADSFHLGDTGKMLVNAIRWCAPGIAAPVVGVPESPALAEKLRGQGLDAREITLAELESVDVLILWPGQTGPGDLEQIRNWVANGKGLVAADVYGAWRQANRGKNPVTDMLSNRLLAPVGLLFVDGVVEPTSDQGYAVGGVPSPLTNASAALDAALAHTAGIRKLDSQQLKQVAGVLERTAHVLPPDDQILLPRLRRLENDPSINAVPSPEHPIKTEDVLSRLVLTMQVWGAEQLPPEQITALPAAATYPGSVPPDAARVTREVRVSTSVPEWHSTGLYAPPGELVTVVIPPEAAGKGLRVRIGSTTCQNWHQAAWMRAPDVVREYSLDEPKTAIASAFGGLVYMVVPRDCQLGDITVTILNTVEAPYFELGKTALRGWKEVIRQYPAPQAELASSKIVITVPSSAVRELDNPGAVLRLWDRILDTAADLATLPHDRKRPERYVADVQLCVGYMHAGYPIMIPTSAAPNILDVTHLVSEGNWGLYHETGHDHQNWDWTFEGTSEVTVNLFTMYIYEQICGIRPHDGRMGEESAWWRITKQFHSGSDVPPWKADPFIGLGMYVQMIDAFGWDAFKKVFAEYLTLSDDQRPKNDDEKRDQWLVRFSRAVGRNLGPFFQAWRVPTSEQARESIKDLPVWMPPNWPPPDPRENRVARKATVVKVSSEDRRDGTGDNAVDGIAGSMWRTRPDAAGAPDYPHEIVMDLGQTLTIQGITVLPQQEGSDGFISDYEVYVSPDGTNWGQPMAQGTFEKTNALKRVMFPNPVACQYIRLVALRGFDGQKSASIAELDVIPAK